MHRYGLLSLAEIQGDQGRSAAYRAALQAAISPGDVVVDIGTGTGYMALWACEFGAKHVYAIEPAPEIELAAKIVAENGLQDRVTLINEMSTDVRLPERADIVVSDLRGVLPFHELHIPSLIDARERLLRQGGTLIAKRDVLRIALANSDVAYQPFDEQWDVAEPSFTMNAGRRAAKSYWQRCIVDTDALVSDPQTLATLDYKTIDNPDLDASVEWTVDESGHANGIQVWFDAELTDEVGFSNQPGGTEHVYGAAFFPFDAELTLSPGDHLHINFRAQLSSSNYYFRWRTELVDRGGNRLEHFDQTNHPGIATDLSTLRRTVESHQPNPSVEALMVATFVECTQQEKDIHAIALALLDRYPETLKTHEEAVNQAKSLSVRYGA